jgi:hypothetical protein
MNRIVMLEFFVPFVVDFLNNDSEENGYCKSTDKDGVGFGNESNYNQSEDQRKEKVTVTGCHRSNLPYA